MKQRFSSLDVRIIAHELSQALITLRLQNIYDLSSKVFLIKFSKNENKKQVVIDTGFRCHLTDYSRATAVSPSMFVQSLRKRLKSRRVTSVSHIGTDRIIEFEFSDGKYRLFLEFYAGGNIILTDKELKILTLLRIVPKSEYQEELRVGLQYVLDNRQNYGDIPPITVERLQDALQSGIDKISKSHDKKLNGKKRKKYSLVKTLALSITEFPPVLVEHAMCVTGFDSTISPQEIVHDNLLLDNLMGSMKYAQLLVEEITSSDISKGYIIAKKKLGYDEVSKETDARKLLTYEDFQPFSPRQVENNPDLAFIEIEGFNKTVDEFFSSIEGQRYKSRLEERELIAERKLDAVRQEQARHIEDLHQIQTLNERKAGAIQANAEQVQEAMDAVNSLIAQGMDWVEIGKLIEVEQLKNNPVAKTIKLPLKLHENIMSIILKEGELDYETDSVYETDPDLTESEDDSKNVGSSVEKSDLELVIDINLGISPWANARSYFDERRTAIHKEESTLESSALAFKNQEARIKENLRNSLKKEKAILRPIRQTFWFEKFFWFLSSDRYLVLAAKDALQSEVIYKKHLKKGDIYLSGDQDGSAIVIIKNKESNKDALIPPSTLCEAGTLAISCSSAWDSKASMSAWWVNAEQVSKSDSYGEILPTGCFHIQGSKNFLPPSVLVLGFGILFQVSDENNSANKTHKDQELIPEETLSIESELRDLGIDQDSPLEKINNVAESGINCENYICSSESLLESSQSNNKELVKDEKTLEPNLQPSKNEEQESRKLENNLTENKSQMSNIARDLTSSKPAQMKRGKKGKFKKIATKYRHQDLEDRIAAQKIIGSVTGQQKALAEASSKATREAELNFQKEKRKAQHEKTQKKISVNEDLRRRIFEGEIDDESDEGKLMVLDNLSRRPKKGDDLIEVIPVCAPISAMRDYKYKMKLQPGSLKRGKVAKEILSRWQLDGEKKGNVDEKSEDRERLWPRELELLKGLKIEEITGVIPVSKMRIMTSYQNAGATKGNGKKNTKLSKK
ncbi:Ribosome quality control complex subunit 2 [Golovinomyces cichoracearum]|uniref:Ribosome quality control complex subunit 2 n=1 Tax=Golovinomyces cichoracearum TaxID=62708 RepID=A0A420ITQ7_9PEZI|nr:Ribosome quality control complex subunit 2 [Golovinomyces cichoracearum]